MYKLIKKISKISSVEYKTYSNGLLCIRDKKLTLLNGNTYRKVWASSMNVLGFYTFESQIIVYLFEKNKKIYSSYLYNPKEDKIRNLIANNTNYNEYVINNVKDKDSYARIGGYYPNDNRFEGVIDLKEKKVVWEMSGKDIGAHSLITQNHIILVYKKFLIKSYNKLTGEFNWELNIQKLCGYISVLGNEKQSGGVQKFIGCYKAHLYVAITNESVLEIDQQTGKLTNLWRDIPKEYVQYARLKTLLEPATSYLSEKEGKIIGLAVEYYWEINLESKQLLYWDLLDTFKKEGVSALATHQLSHQGTRLYFYSIGYQEKNPTRLYQLVIFNRLNRTIEWTYSFGEELGFNFRGAAPLVQDNRIYVKGNNNILYVFEKE